MSTYFLAISSSPNFGRSLAHSCVEFQRVNPMYCKIWLIELKQLSSQFCRILIPCLIDLYKCSLFGVDKVKRRTSVQRRYAGSVLSPRPCNLQVAMARCVFTREHKHAKRRDLDVDTSDIEFSAAFRSEPHVISINGIREWVKHTH